MKRIYVSITYEEYVMLVDVALDHDAKPGELLAAFVADITHSSRSGGSDERMYANDWLSRQVCRWEDGKMIT